ncbi:MAG: DMT family transporter [Pseudomonadota bacterium]
MTTQGRIDSPYLAIGLYVSNLMIMVLISGLVKHLSDHYPVTQILLFRFALAAVPLFLFTITMHGLEVMKTERYQDHAIRSVSGICSLSMLYFALSMIPIAEATMIAYSSPIFITILSIPLLGEKIGIARWSAVLIGFAGVMIIAQPGTQVFNLGGLLALGSALGGAMVVLWLRKLSDTEHPGLTSFIYNSLGALVFIIVTLYVGWHEVMSWIHWLLLAAVGLLAAVQQYLFAFSLRFGEASLIAPFEYLILLFAVAAGIIFWNEIPPTTSVIGGTVIVASGLIIIFRANKKKVQTQT